MTELLHRIFLAPVRPDLDRVGAHAHWTNHHATVFARNPHLLGYVQNRPLPSAWPSRTHVCAEAWFADRSAERSGYASEYYRTVVTDDENRFVDRDHAWSTSVTMVSRAVSTRKYRVIVFGHTRETAAPWAERWADDALDVFRLQRPPLTGGEPAAVAFWTDDLAMAQDVATSFGPTALLAEPVPVVPPPEPPWTTAAREPEESR